ncbi:hypothetical protein TXIAM_90281 [Tenacibaculum xiamenense]
MARLLFIQTKQTKTLTKQSANFTHLDNDYEKYSFTLLCMDSQQTW